MEPYRIFTIVCALACSAFFSGIETAFLAADKLGIELEKERRTFTGRILAVFSRRPDRFISTTLVGNTIALVIYGASMAKLLDPLFRFYLPIVFQHSGLSLILQTLISTLGILVLAEFIPKSIFLLSPNRMLSLFAFPAAILAYLLYPFVVATTAISKSFIVYVLGQPYREARPAFGLTDLHTFIKNSLNINPNLPAGISARIVSNLIEFRKMKARDCMIPRKEIVAVNIKEGIEALKKAVMQSNYAKVLVYRNDIDDIIGYCHVQDLFKKPRHIESILTPVVVVPEINMASEVMVRLTTEGKSLALVVDEFGGTSGIISLEDIIEEIVGEIQESRETSTLLTQQLDEHSYLVSARHEIDDLNEKYGWEIPQGDYDTLGGFITSAIERIPETDEKIVIAPFTFTIVAMEDTRISTVKVDIDPRNKGD